MMLRKCGKKEYTNEDLELGVIPKSTFLQRLRWLFTTKIVIRKKKQFSLFDYLFSFESKLNDYQHRMELIRTIATCTNMIASICVLLKVFKII